MSASELMPIALDTCLFIPATALRVDWSFLQAIGGIELLRGLQVEFKFGVLEGAAVIVSQHILMRFTHGSRQGQEILIRLTVHLLLQFLHQSIHETLQQFFLCFGVGTEVGVEGMQVGGEVEGQWGVELEGSLYEAGELTQEGLHLVGQWQLITIMYIPYQTNIISQEAASIDLPIFINQQDMMGWIQGCSFYICQKEGCYQYSINQLFHRSLMRWSGQQQMMDDDVQIQMGDYVFTEKYCIGQGSFGKVYRGRNVKSGREVAIKQMDGELISEQEIGRQITILKQLKHPNIVEYEDAFQNNGYFYIVTEYCKGGDLRNLLQSSDEEESPERQRKVLDMFWQVCQGFRYLRGFDIIHRDLKPSNILLHGGQYKIADFGLARRQMVHRSVVHQEMMGVPIYLSPQILSKNHYTYKCDVWSLGIIAFEMLFDHRPWKANDVQTLFFQIMNNPEPYAEHAGSVTPIFAEIFKKTLAYLEKARSSWDELLVLRDAKLPEGKKKAQKGKDKQKYKQKKKEDVVISRIHKTIVKQQAQILKHILGQGRALQSQLNSITNAQCLRGLFITIKKYVQQGTQLRGMLRDCCFIFLKLVGNNLHLQLMEYEELQQSRQLLVFIQLLHDYVSNTQLSASFSKKSFQNSLANKGISEYAASVISKVNTLLLTDQQQQP